MTAVWLYETDGRAITYAYVQTPLAPAVVYGGRVFHWDASLRGYRASDMPPPCPILKEIPKELWPEEK